MTEPWTKTPNAIYAAMSDMSDAELRVTLVLVRHTYGYHQTFTKLTYGQIMSESGLDSKASVAKGLKAVADRGFFTSGDGRSVWLICHDCPQPDGRNGTVSEPFADENSSVSEPNDRANGTVSEPFPDENSSVSEPNDRTNGTVSEPFHLYKEKKEKEREEKRKRPTPASDYQNKLWNVVLDYARGNEAHAVVVYRALSVFADKTNIKPPFIGRYGSSDIVAGWLEPLENMLEMAGHDLDIFGNVVADATSRADDPNGNFTVTRPKSLQNTFNGLLARRKRAQYQQEPAGYGGLTANASGIL